MRKDITNYVNRRSKLSKLQINIADPQKETSQDYKYYGQFNSNIIEK